MKAPSDDPAFFATRWTLVERTRGQTAEARAALRELCAAYYAPVVAFIGRELAEPDAARDLAHDFFAVLLTRESLGDPDRDLGRFRNYLLGAVKHFLINKRRDAGRDKRGGGVTPVSLGEANEPADAREMPSDAFFDRQWALAIVERALLAMQQESETAGNADQFAALRPWIAPGGAAPAQAEVAERLHITEGAVKVAIHRLRSRFRTLVRNDVAQTLSGGADLDEEMRYLVDALAADRE